MGAHLNEFQYTQVQVSSPKTWSVSQLTEWLVLCLGFNTETHTIGVHALWTRSTGNIFWYLKHIERDDQWVRLLQSCERRGCHHVALLLPVLKSVTEPEVERSYEYGESSVGMHDWQSIHASHAGDDFYEAGQSSQEEVGDADDYLSGEADADEIDGHMQNEMHEEDIAGDISDESAEPDGEEQAHEVPIPTSWN